MEIHHFVQFDFSCSALAKDTFRLAEFEGTETVSQPFQFVVDLASKDAEVDVEDVIDRTATLSITRGDDAPSVVTGIVADFFQSQQVLVDYEYWYLYRVVLVPRLWRLSLSTQSRIYQDLTVREIVSDILDETGVDHEWHLAETYKPREYTTQYKETDLDFVQRLLEYEGIRYCFRHTAGKDVLVLSDDAGDATPIDGTSGLLYNAQAVHLDEGVDGFIARRRLVTGTAETKDYNYRTPAADLHSKSALDTTAALGVHSDSMIHTMEQGRSDRLTRVRSEELESERVVMTGNSNCVRFRAGFQFTLQEHYRNDLNQKYLLTHVVHTGTNADVISHGAGTERKSGYANSFTCVPASVPYRPPRVTPVPKLPGVLTAKVESAGGDYAPIDDQGRYRIRFPFDLGGAGKAQATKPVRLAQPYSGPGYGQHFPVHKDAEMVVACVDGNVDRIIGLSTVPNPNQASPVTSGNQTENTVKTFADNHIILQDLKGNVGIDIMTPTATSRLHLGAAEEAVEGIQSSTKGTQTLQADGGIFMKVGETADHLKGILASKDLQQLMADMTKVDAAIGVGLAAIGAGQGFLKNQSFWNSAFNTAVGTAMGLTWPGLYVAAEGGVIVGTPAGISAYAGGGGIGLTTATGIDLTAMKNGINLMVGVGGIHLGVGQGGIHSAAGEGDIKTNAKTGNVLTEARDNILLTSHEKNIHVQAPDASGNIGLAAGNDVEVEAKKNGKSTYGEKLTVEVGASAEYDVKDKITFKCGQSQLVMSSDGTIEIKGGQNSIKLSASGIEVKAPTNLKMEGKMGVDVKGMQVKIKADLMAALEGVMTDVKGSGIASIKGALTKVG